MRRKRNNPLGISWFWWLTAAGGAYYVYVYRKKKAAPESAKQIVSTTPAPESLPESGSNLYTGIFSGGGYG